MQQLHQLTEQLPEGHDEIMEPHEFRPFAVVPKGGPDRDAQNVPYTMGNRQERRRIAKRVEDIAAKIRSKKREK